LKKGIAIFTAVCIVILASGCAKSADVTGQSENISVVSAADTDYNKLQTITVFGETAPSGSGIPTLEPKDETSSMPSVMIESSMRTR